MKTDQEIKEYLESKMRMFNLESEEGVDAADTFEDGFNMAVKFLQEPPKTDTPLTIQSVIEEIQRTGEMPQVKALKDMRGDVKENEIGIVTKVVFQSNKSGIAVRFSKNYDCWFWDGDKESGRTLYMKDLKFVRE